MQNATNCREASNFPSVSNEIKCCFVGFSESIGHAMTYKVLTTDTKKVLYRSRIRLASDNPNIRLDNEQQHDTTASDSEDTTTYDPGGTYQDIIKSRDKWIIFFRGKICKINERSYYDTDASLSPMNKKCFIFYNLKNRRPKFARYICIYRPN